MRAIHDVLILGATARAAAFSALRASLRPHCVDYFADVDLAAVCPAVAIDPRRFDEELERVAIAPRVSSWLHVGPIENRPELVERLSRRFRHLGNDAETLRAVRDPWNVAAALNRWGVAAPRLAKVADGPPAAGQWLVKPLASAGGAGVRFWDGEPPESATSHYLQEFIDGPTLSALFVAAKGAARLLGIARQHQGAPGLPFLYRGSVAPWPVANSIVAKLDRLGGLLAAEFGLVGLFGVDFILDGDGEPRPIEINPRYTASVEAFELAARRSLLADHVRACAGGELPEAPFIQPSSSIVGKRVVYASRPIRFPEVSIPRFSAAGFDVPPIADIPRPGATIPPGEPIMTVMARGRDPMDCLARLDEMERAWLERLAAV